MGWGVFSSYEFETQEDWDRNAAILLDYREVNPRVGQCATCKYETAYGTQGKRQNFPNN